MSTTIHSGQGQNYQLTKKESTVYENNQFVVAEAGGTGKVVPAGPASTSMLGFATKAISEQTKEYAEASDLPVTIIDGSTHLEMDIDTSTVVRADELQHFSLNAEGDSIDGSTKSESTQQFQLIKIVSETRGIFICTSLSTSSAGGGGASGPFSIVNNTTNNTISVDQNGSVGSDPATDGAVHIENTGNVSIGLSVYTEQGSPASAPLVYIKVSGVGSDPSTFDQDMVQLDNAGTGSGLHIVQSGAGQNNKRALMVEQITPRSGSGAQQVLFYSNQVEVSPEPMFKVWGDNASSTSNLVFLDSDGNGDVLQIRSDGDGTHIRFLGDPTPTSPDDGSFWFDGADLKLRVGSTTYNLNKTAV